MIIIPEETLHDQQGMEEAFRIYWEKLFRDNGSTMNAVLKPQQLDCSFENRTLTLAVKAETWMMNPNNVMHGGITASVADMVMGLVSRYFSGGKITPTIQMDISYLAPVPNGSTLICRAELVKAGFNITTAVARLWTAGDPETPVATATGTYHVSRHFAPKNLNQA